MGQSLRLFAFIIVIGMGTAWLIGQREQVAEVAQGLAEQQSHQTGSSSERGAEDDEPIRGLRLQAHSNGHFYLEVQVNGARIPFLVDTGASSVMLTREAARKARINPNRSQYTMRAHTANGTVQMAPVTLREMRVGQFRTTNVRGAVNDADMGISLLGMTFLSRLRRYEVKEDELILYW